MTTPSSGGPASPGAEGSRQGGSDLRLGRFRPWQVVGLLALLLYLPWLGGRSLWFPDEPDLAEPTMTMVRTGDWVVPHQNDDPWLDYPPLTYWLGAITSTVAGSISPLALRLPIALLGVLFVVLTTFVTTRLAGDSAGLWAGLTLATTPHFVYQAINFHPDMAFAMLIASGIALYAWGYLRPPPSWKSAALKAVGFACFGGAILAKGPLGLLLPGMVLTLWLASRKEWKAVLWLAPLSLVSLVVAAPWYLLLVDRTSFDFVWTELYLQNFDRFGSADRGHDEPWWYYFEKFWLDWAPWSLLLPAAFVAAFRDRWKEPETRLALIWFFASFLFFTGAATKREVYLLPCYPALAFLLGTHLRDVLADSRAKSYRWFPKTLGVGALVSSVVIAVALLARGLSSSLLRPSTLEVFDTVTIPVAALSLALALGGLALIRGARKALTSGALATATLGLAVVYTVAMALLLPKIDDSKSYREAAVWLRQETGAYPFGYYPRDITNKLAGFRIEDPAFMPLHVVHTPKEAVDYLGLESRLVILNADHTRDLEEALPDWESVPKREFRLGSRLFLILGPRQGEGVR